MKVLRLPDHRQPVYYGRADEGSPSSVRRWTSHCQSMALQRKTRELMRLRALQHIYIRLELGRKFRDWHLHMQCAGIRRYHIMLRSLRRWRIEWMRKRFSILLLIGNNPIGQLKHMFCIWKDVTLYYRAVEFNNVNITRKHFIQWALVLKDSRLKSLFKYFELWKKWLRIIHILRKLGFLERYFPYLAFCRWKKLTFDAYNVDMSPVLRRMEYRVKETVFAYLRDTADEMADARLLAGLPKQSDSVPPSPKQRSGRSTRKAPLDTRRPTCACVWNICRGRRCECTFDTHFRRRISLCYDEVQKAREDKQVARETVRRSTVARSLEQKRARVAEIEKQVISSMKDGSFESIGNTDQNEKISLPEKESVDRDDESTNLLNMPAVSMFAPRSRRSSVVRELSPERIRKEARNKIKGPPSHDAFSRWSLDESVVDISKLHVGCDTDFYRERV